jgi:hypothetical protein
MTSGAAPFIDCYQTVALGTPVGLSLSDIVTIHDPFDLLPLLCV